MNLKCPICHQQLNKELKIYHCCNGHSFDISKEGYVNLLNKQGHKQYGDSLEMIKARSLFLASGYYQPLRMEILKVIKQYSITNLVDSGCGEGYYTNYLKLNLPKVEVIGLDIAKRAIQYARKEGKDVTYIVGSNQDIPIMNDNVDLILNCFAPIVQNEYYRILRPNGLLVTIQPGINHLLSLKQSVYDNVYLNEEKTNISDFKQIYHQQLDFTLELNTTSDIIQLFQMTPYYQRTKQQDKQKLEQLTKLTTEAAFMINVYQKEQ